MNFQPLVPIGGIAGWRFLTRTMDTQKTAHDNTPQIKRDVQYFKDNIGKVTSAEALVADRRLLGVALGAFGLDADIDNRFFIKKVLSDGTLQDNALANRLADKRYLELSKAFGFGDFDTPRTQLSEFGNEITTAYQTRQFEIAVGTQDDDMRLALNLSRELSALAERDTSDETKWFTIMGSEPLKQVFETAFGLPSAFGTLDLDRQLATFRDKASRLFGSSEVSQFTDPERRDELLQKFLARSQSARSLANFSPAATALTLLQSAQR